VAIVKYAAQVRTRNGDTLGDGVAYIHLPRGVDRAQSASGTVSLREWNPSAGEPAELELADGRRMSVTVSRDALTDCSRNRILRFTAEWPPRDSPPA
jgi:hypothetical protein